MTALKKFFIYLMLGVVLLIGVMALFWELGADDKNGTMKYITECHLTSSSGQTLSIRQGTVGRVERISIGLKSIKDGKANVQFWDAKTNVSGPTLTLGSCESTDFEGYTIYILTVKDNLENPLGKLGSSSDSIEVFVKKY